MSRRSKLFTEMCKLIGTPPLVSQNPQSGWPGTVEVAVPSGAVIPVALHVSHVGSHSRAEYELRFQNPGDRSPVLSPGVSVPLLVGYYEQNGKSIFVGVDGRSRNGRNARFSILFQQHLVDEAATRGWAVYTSSKEENIYAFNPALFPIFAEMVARGIDARPAIATSHKIADAVIASGLLDEDTEPARKRARRAAEIPIRHHAFGRTVVSCYNGECAMCGLDYGLLSGAHIYPVEAPGSPDKVWNGIALCPNHHAVFDAHKIWVDPASYKIAIHPNLIGETGRNAALKAFVDTTYPKLTTPTLATAKPRGGMFERRYNYFEDHYKWAG